MVVPLRYRPSDRPGGGGGFYAKYNVSYVPLFRGKLSVPSLPLKIGPIGCYRNVCTELRFHAA
jgi:hypothetical protein